MFEFAQIFEPGLRHVAEERERQRMEISRPGDAAPPFGGDDLDSGTIVVDGEPDGLGPTADAGEDGDRRG